MEAAAETINAGSVPRAAFWLKAISDKSLVKLIAAGSDEAFTIVYQRYHGPLFAYCVSMLQDYGEAEDALHEIMIRTHATLRESERDIEIKPWLFRCARNHCLNVIQRRAVRDGAMQDLVREHERVDSKVEMNEEVRLVLQDVSHLPDEQRQALLMREASGLSHEAIAEALDVNAAKAKRLLFEARRSLHAGAEGRGMACAEVRFEMSQGDGRTGRRRNLRSHIRSCEGCLEFQESMKSRRAVLAGGIPLLGPEAALAALAKILGSASAAEAATVTAGSAGATGIAAKLAGSGLMLQKGVAIVAVAGLAAAGGFAVKSEFGDGGGPQNDALVSLNEGTDNKTASAETLAAAEHTKTSSYASSTSDDGVGNEDSSEEATNVDETQLAADSNQGQAATEGDTQAGQQGKHRSGRKDGGKGKSGGSKPKNGDAGGGQQDQPGQSDPTQPSQPAEPSEPDQGSPPGSEPPPKNDPHFCEKFPNDPICHTGDPPGGQPQPD